MRLTDQLPARGARVEMIPLIDTMFLLLVFFVAAILSMEFLQGIPVDLARSATSTSAASDGVAVTITAEEALFVDGVLVEPAELVPTIRARQNHEDGEPVIVAADAGVRFEAVLELFDRLRAAKIEKVFLQTRKKSP